MWIVCAWCGKVMLQQGGSATLRWLVSLEDRCDCPHCRSDVTTIKIIRSTSNVTRQMQYAKWIQPQTRALPEWWRVHGRRCSRNNG